MHFDVVTVVIALLPGEENQARLSTVDVCAKQEGRRGKTNLLLESPEVSEAVLISLMTHDPAPPPGKRSTARGREEAECAGLRPALRPGRVRRRSGSSRRTGLRSALSSSENPTCGRKKR